MARLPGIITEELRFLPKLHQMPNEEFAAPVDTKDSASDLAAKKRLLYIGVSCLMALILVMWGYNAYMTFYVVRDHGTKSNGLLSSASADLQKTLADLDENSAPAKITTTTPTTTLVSTSSINVAEKLKIILEKK